MVACFLASFDLATAAQFDTDEEVRHTERMSYARLKTAAILASDTHDLLMWVSADDYDTLYQKGS